MVRPKKQATINLGFLNGGKTDNPLRPNLSSLITSTGAERAPITENDEKQARLIVVEQLSDNPYQPRMEIPPESLEELAGAMRSQGFLGALVARPNPFEEETAGSYQLAFGHRRREAAKLAGLKTIPVIIQELSDEDMATIAVMENLHREDLSAVELGKIFVLMIEEFGFTQEQVAKSLGKSRGYVENRLRVAHAPIDVQNLVRIKPNSLRAVPALSGIIDEELRKEVIGHFLDGTLTTDDLPAYLAQRKERSETLEYKRAKELSEQETTGKSFADFLNNIPEPLNDPMNTSANIHARNRTSSKGKAHSAQTKEQSYYPTSSSFSPEKEDDVGSPSYQLARVGAAKLATVSRTLIGYQAALKTRTSSLSIDEQKLLEDIYHLVSEIRDAYTKEVKD